MNDTQDADLAVDPKLVAACLERIFASPEFVRSERMMSFLRYVVERALTDRKQTINERAIGQAVFNRPDDWDPTVDTIVRSESRRLRAKLDQYYVGLGRDDRLRIRIPKGTYVPEFVEKAPGDPPPEEPPAIRPALPPREEAVPQVPAKASRSFLLPSLVLGVVACLLLLLVLGLGRRNVESSHRSDFATVPFTTDFGKEYSPAIAPDGRTVAYTWDDGDGAPDIYLRKVDSKQSRRLSQTSETRLYPSWSHDGSRIAFLALRGDRLAVVVHVLATGAESTVTSIERSVGQWSEDNSPLLGCPGPVWSADDRSLILYDRDGAAASGGLIRVGLDGTRQAQITSTTGELHDLYPRVSPDGKSIAFVRYSSHGVGEIFVQLLDDPRSAQALTKDHRTIQGLAWTQDGRDLIFSSNRTGYFQLWSIGAAGGPVTSVPTDSSWAGESSVAGNGSWLVYVQANNNWNIWRRPLTGPGPAERLIASSGRNYDARPSPDGQRIAFASDRGGYMELWASDTDGHNAVQLTHLLANWLGGINWSPDGKTLAFDARPADHSAIYLIPAAGGEPKPLDAGAFEERMPVWSADGRSIYFNSNREGTTAIFSNSLADGFTRLISPPGMFSVSVSGDQLIIGSLTGELFHSDLNGAHFEALPGHPRAEPVMSWAVDRGDVLLTQYDPRLKGYTLARSRAGQSAMLGDLDGTLVPNAPDIAVSADGKWLLYSRQETAQSDLMIRRHLE